jgi:HSP20 family protein
VTEENDMSDEMNFAEGKPEQQPESQGAQGAQGPQGAPQSPQQAAPAGNAVSTQGSGQAEEGALLPAVDVIEDAGGITLYADLPGVPKENLRLHLERDSLTIEGVVGLDVPQGMQSNLAELRLPRYRRVFTLSRELDGEQTSAELKNGVLKLRIPKAQHAQPRKIAINVT